MKITPSKLVFTTENTGTLKWNHDHMSTLFLFPCWRNNFSQDNTLSSHEWVSSLPISTFTNWTTQEPGIWAFPSSFKLGLCTTVFNGPISSSGLDWGSTDRISTRSHSLRRAPDKIRRELSNVFFIEAATSSAQIYNLAVPTSTLLWRRKLGFTANCAR